MKRFLIGLIVLLTSSCVVQAQENVLLSSETLVLTLPNHSNNENISNKKTLPVNNNSSIKKEIKSEVKKVEDINEVPNKTKIILNEKVLNYSLQSMGIQLEKPNEIIYKETQRYFDSIDPVKQAGVTSYYPGLRGPNQLVIYTPSFGERTGTNEFGTEAIVHNHMVVSLNGADSIIPEDGFVISGHGQAKKWINQNIQLGSKVYVDDFSKTVRVYLTPESLIYSAKEKLREVNEIVEYYKSIDILYNDKKATDYLEAAKDELRRAEKKPEKAQAYIEDAMENLSLAIQNAIPYNNKELKGVWLRPVEQSEKDIVKTIERLHNTGITDVFLETYYHGKTIYPSEFLKEKGVIPQREEFVGFDPLQVWIDEAHKRGMKIHTWFETFYVGNDNPSTTPKHVLNVNPSWSNKRLMNYTSVEPVYSLSEHKGYFLDPANLQVQEYLTSIVKELVEKYKIDGINLDYIRYPQTVDSSFSNYATMNWGYTQAARDEFLFLYGIDPITIKYGTGDWELWATYRQNKITDFIKNVKKITKTANIQLTAVIFPDLKKSITTKMQNWKVWSYNDYVDGVTPLILTGDKNTADLLLKDVVNNTSSFTSIYPGIFVTFMGGTKDELLTQIHKTREVNSKGLILFDYAHLTDNYIDAISVRAYNQDYEPRDMKMKSVSSPNLKVKYKEKKKKKSKRRR